MFAALAVAVAMTAASQPVMQVPVDDPLLPTGPLQAMGATPEGDFYVDAASFGRSDLAGVIRMTAVIVRPVAASDPAPLLVARVWVDCKRGVYQLSSGRRYGRDGTQVALTSFVRDQPIGAGTAPARIAEAYCPANPAKATGETVLADYRAALARSESGSAP